MKASQTNAYAAITSGADGSCSLAGISVTGMKFGLARLREDRRVHQQQDGETDSFHSSLSR